jgi:hypothetical protein
MIEPVIENAKGQSLSVGHDLIPAGAVRKNTWNLGDLADPATVLFALDLDVELAHVDSPLGDSIYQQSNVLVVREMHAA